MSFEIISGITRDEDLAFEFLQEHYCIRSSPPFCSYCERGMLWVRSGHGNSHVWRCQTHKSHQMSPRCGSFWENSKLPLSKLVQLAFFWSFNITNKTCEEFTGVTTPIVTQWYKYFRNVCSHYLSQNPVVIGGLGVKVELSHFTMPRKHKKVFTDSGSDSDSESDSFPERSIFGGLCVASQESFLVLVPDVDAETILPIIQKHVLPGSIIQTSGQITAEIESQNFKLHFVHQPIERGSVNLENHWRKAKKKFRLMCGVQSDSVNSYLDEFQWRERFAKNGMDAFKNLLSHISQWYPTT